MSRTISSIVHSSIQIFHRLKILLDKKKIVSYLEVFQQIVGFNFIVNWHQTIFSSLSLHTTFIGWGGVLPSVVRTRKCRPPRAKKSQLIIYSCRVAKLFMSHSAFKTRLRDKDKRAKISKLVIDVNITAFGCQMLIT